MVDRQNLRETAQSAGESIAGTFKSAGSKAKQAGQNFVKNTKKGAGQIKSDITGKGTSADDVTLAYDQENEKYIVFAGEKPIRDFDDEMQAKAYARKLKGQIQNAQERNTESVTDKFKSAATSAAESFEADQDGGERDGSDMDDERGEMAGEDETGPMLPGFGESAENGDSSPELPFMDDASAGEGDAPTLPGFGPQGESEDGQDTPTLPGFGGPDDSDGAPQLPGFGGGESDGSPTVPGFGMQDQEQSDDSEQYPWMF